MKEISLLFCRYTSFSELFPLLAAGTLPLVKVGEISQFIDSNALTVENSVTFTGPLATTSFSTSASFEIRSPKRVQVWGLSMEISHFMTMYLSIIPLPVLLEIAKWTWLPSLDIIRH